MNKFEKYHSPFPCSLDSTLARLMGIHPFPVSSEAELVERTGDESREKKKRLNDEERLLNE